MYTALTSYYTYSIHVPYNSLHIFIIFINSKENLCKLSIISCVQIQFHLVFSSHFCDIMPIFLRKFITDINGLGNGYITIYVYFKRFPFM